MGSFFASWVLFLASRTAPKNAKRRGKLFGFPFAALREVFFGGLTKKFPVEPAPFSPFFASFLTGDFVLEVPLWRVFLQFGLQNAKTQKPEWKLFLASEKKRFLNIFHLAQNHNILCYVPRSPQQAVVERPKVLHRLFPIYRENEPMIHSLKIRKSPRNAAH